MTETTQDKRASSSSPSAGHKVDTSKPIETTEQLRIAIDQGNGKVDATDPAAAPLGTDDEAGGTPNSYAQVRLAAAYEIRSNKQRQRNGGLGHAWWIIGATLVLGSLIVIAAIWTRYLGKEAAWSDYENEAKPTTTPIRALGTCSRYDQTPSPIVQWGRANLGVWLRREKCVEVVVGLAFLDLPHRRPVRPDAREAGEGAGLVEREPNVSPLGLVELAETVERHHAALSGPSHRVQCLLFTLRMFVVPPSGSIRNNFLNSTCLPLACCFSARFLVASISAFDDDGMPHRAVASSRPSAPVRMIGDL